MFCWDQQNNQILPVIFFDKDLTQDLQLNLLSSFTMLTSTTCAYIICTTLGSLLYNGDRIHIFTFTILHWVSPMSLRFLALPRLSALDLFYVYGQFFFSSCPLHGLFDDDKHFGFAFTFTFASARSSNLSIGSKTYPFCLEPFLNLHVGSSANNMSPQLGHKNLYLLA